MTLEPRPRSPHTTGACGIRAHSDEDHRPGAQPRVAVVETFRSCEVTSGPNMPVTRHIAGQPYCFAHGMDIYCD